MQSKFYVLYQYMRGIALAIAIWTFIFCYVKSHCFVYDIEVDLHGHIERLRKELDKDMMDPEIWLKDWADLNDNKEPEPRERE